MVSRVLFDLANHLVEARGQRGLDVGGGAGAHCLRKNLVDIPLQGVQEPLCHHGIHLEAYCLAHRFDFILVLGVEARLCAPVSRKYLQKKKYILLPNDIH